MSNFFTRASDFGYHFDSLPDYMKNNNDVGRTVYDIAYLPPDSDDDAFRLMVELGLSLEYLRMWVDEIDPDKKVCFIQWAPGGIQCRVLEDLFDVGSDSCEITRRGIVKAAAEIGRRKSG